MNPEYFYQVSSSPIEIEPMSEEDKARIADMYAQDPIFKLQPGTEGEWLKTSDGKAVFVPKEAFDIDEYIKEAA